MPLPPIAYLEWARTRYGLADIEMATSGVAPVPADFLGGLPPLDALDAADAFAAALGGRLAQPPDEVVPALGTSQAIWLAIAAATDPGDLVAIEEPGYEPLVRVAEGLGRRVVRLERRFEDRWQVDPARAEALLEAGARLVVLSDLHNPSGVELCRESLVEVARRAARSGAHVLVDEVYRAFDPTRARSSARSAAPNVLAAASLTKVFGLGWARAGWLLAPPPIAAEARRALLHAVGVNPPAHAALGLQALGAIDRLRERTEALLERGEKQQLVSAWIAARPDVEWVPPARGLFGFPRLIGVDDTRPLCTTLLERHSMLVAPGAFFGAPAHLRISWGAPRDRIERGLDLFGSLLRDR